jgi:hypothetical protein
MRRASLLAHRLRGIRSQRVQCDEIWSFVGAKEKNVSVEKKAAGSPG